MLRLRLALRTPLCPAEAEQRQAGQRERRGFRNRFVKLWFASVCSWKFCWLLGAAALLTSAAGV